MQEKTSSATEKRLNKMKACMETNINILQEKWELANGNNQDMLNKKYDECVANISILLNAMMEEERQNLADLEHNIEHTKKEILTLQEELRESFPLNVDDTLPLIQQRQTLNTVLDQLVQKKEAIINRFQQLRKEELNLLTSLGWPNEIYLEHVSVPTTQQLEELTTHVSEMADELSKRQQKKLEVMELIRELDITVGEEEENILNHDHCTNRDMQNLQKLKASLFIQKESNCKEEKRLRSTLQKLWDKLQVSVEERNEFMKDHRGIGKKAIQRLSEKVKDCEDQWLDKMTKNIPELRSQLLNLWDLCKVTPEERKQFGAFNTDSRTIEVAKMLEQEVDKYKDHYERNRIIYDLAESRSGLIKELDELESKSQNPDRLWSNRGGTLLREENQKKRIKKHLSKIENELIRLLKVNESAELVHGKQFLYNGEPLLNALLKNQNISEPKTPGTPTSSRRFVVKKKP